jgi:tRNA(adenine34) deaminase
MENLSREWNLCLSLALEAIAAGSFGIGSIITTASGEVISRGRNQLNDSNDSCNINRNSPVSHAELNAIAGLPSVYREDKSLILYATVEPCPMCMGAIVMSNIKKLRIASRDPWAGSVRLLAKDWYLDHKGISAQFESGWVEELFFLISLYSLQKDLECRGLTNHPVLTALRSQYPLYYSRSEVRLRDKEFIQALTHQNSACLINKIQSV